MRPLAPSTQQPYESQPSGRAVGAEVGVDVAVESVLVELGSSPCVEYTERRLPAPQKVQSKPAHFMLHSDAGALVDPALSFLPQ